MEEVALGKGTSPGAEEQPRSVTQEAGLHGGLGAWPVVQEVRQGQAPGCGQGGLLVRLLHSSSEKLNCSDLSAKLGEEAVGPSRGRIPLRDLDQERS